MKKQGCWPVAISFRGLSRTQIHRREKSYIAWTRRAGVGVATEVPRLKIQTPGHPRFGRFQPGFESLAGPFSATARLGTVVLLLPLLLALLLPLLLALLLPLLLALL